MERATPWLRRTYCFLGGFAAAHTDARAGHDLRRHARHLRGTKRRPDLRRRPRVSGPLVARGGRELGAPSRLYDCVTSGRVRGSCTFALSGYPDACGQGRLRVPSQLRGRGTVGQPRAYPLAGDRHERAQPQGHPVLPGVPAPVREPWRDSVALRVSVPGSTFGLLCPIAYGLVGYFSGRLGDVLVEKPRVAGALGRVRNGMLVALGLRFAVPEQR